MAYGILGVAPSQDASDHQDSYMFRIGNPNLNLHLPLILGGGHTQMSNEKSPGWLGYIGDGILPSYIGIVS